MKNMKMESENKKGLEEIVTLVTSNGGLGYEIIKDGFMVRRSGHFCPNLSREFVDKELRKGIKEIIYDKGVKYNTAVLQLGLF